MPPGGAHQLHPREPPPAARELRQGRGPEAGQLLVARDTGHLPAGAEEPSPVERQAPHPAFVHQPGVGHLQLADAGYAG
ncbi:MAG TPA: hypothetical protein VII47_01950, partial [Actinomycetota bacterium]